VKVIRNIKVPTGNILIVEGDLGQLELLSLGDYGKEKNVKADFMGLEREINGVPHGDLIPLEEKWVITISSQYGCTMGCAFCDVPKVGPGRNATHQDLISQVITGIKLHPEVKATKRLNIHFARMGEPTFNNDVLLAAKDLKQAIRPYIGRSLVHPVVSTMLPRKNRNLETFLNEWVDIKNDFYRGDAGLQFSINSTNNQERKIMFNGNAVTIEEAGAIGQMLDTPKGRKYCLNFALAGYEINSEKLRDLFHPDQFMCKITPMHVTKSCERNGILTQDGYSNYYPYKEVEENLKRVGFDVLVFIPSIEEDQGRITCGNAILSGTKPECNFIEEKVSKC
jgi:23S rRNA (adenine2503-C2)-methyltransferase